MLIRNPQRRPDHGDQNFKMLSYRRTGGVITADGKDLTDSEVEMESRPFSVGVNKCFQTLVKM